MPIIVIVIIIVFVALIIELIAQTWQYITIGIIGIATVIFFYKLFWYLLEKIYFNSSNFQNLKLKLQKNIQECNELNTYIESLKTSFLNIGRTDLGEAVYQDKSQWNYTRSALETLAYCNRIYDCSSSVCKHAQEQPFKYFCKYFNVPVNEETLINFEIVFNNFSSAEQGKTLLLEEREKLVAGIKDYVPFLIYRYKRQKLFDNLGFSSVAINDVYFPKYTFRYMSPAGKSSLTCDIVFDINILERFIKYLSNLIKFRASVAGQRALMTTALRNKIKQRDNYTCQCCGVSVYSEPHILLEIDHIKPLSKGGLTTESNLQTLCWKCNRSKSNKFEEDFAELDFEENHSISTVAANITNVQNSVHCQMTDNVNIISDDAKVKKTKEFFILKPESDHHIEIRPRKRIGMMIGAIFFGFYAFLFGVGFLASIGGIYKMLPMMAFVISFSILSYMFWKLANTLKNDTHIGSVKKSTFVLRCISASILSLVILLVVLTNVVACIT